jgi:hypothetical protein
MYELVAIDLVRQRQEAAERRARRVLVEREARAAHKVRGRRR